MSDEHSLGNYDKITGKIVIFANKHSNLHELEGTVFHEGFHRYSNEIDNKLADFFWANKEHFPNTMKRLELLGYTKDEYAEELAAFRIEAMLNDAKWKTADEIFQGDNKKLIENYLDYIGYDRAGEEEIRRKWIDGTRDRRNRERVRGRVIQGISRNSAKNGTQRESKQDVKRLQIGSTETSENIAEDNTLYSGTKKDVYSTRLQTSDDAQAV